MSESAALLKKKKKYELLPNPNMCLSFLNLLLLVMYVITQPWLCQDVFII